MTLPTLSWKRLGSFLCILLILTCASAVIIPHSHEHAGYDCRLCEIVEISRSMSLGLFCSILICQLTDHCCISIIQTDSFAERERTPVDLKVKLSN